MIYKNKKLVIGCFILLSIATMVYIINDGSRFEKVKFSGLQTKKRDNPNPLRKNKVVLTNIHMGIGRGNSLGLVLASPYSSRKQQSQLYRYSIKIKNDFLLNVGEEKLNEWVKQKNFHEIRSTFRSIVNKYLDEPIPEVYISRFFYE